MLYLFTAKNAYLQNNDRIGIQSSQKIKPKDKIKKEGTLTN
jgi:hypothetical protein